MRTLPMLLTFMVLLSPSALAADRARNQIVVSPQGPRDGGDFGPHTPGTKTSGLQEALDAAKERVKDVYIAGGSWTAGKNEPVVYHLHETLRVPWMQDFRLDSGHCVLNYTPRTGDAVVFDSQMSCAYRFGLIVSQSDGAVVRLRPATAGPDRFKVITSSEFTFNALVGGGGAWPGGEAYANELDPARQWKGSGLWLDAAEGPIDGNKITVLETVGCNIGLLLTGASTRNSIEEINIHLCRNHVQIGGPDDSVPNDNRIEAFMDSQGIAPTSGARVFGARNLLVLSTRQTSTSEDLVFEPSAAGNIALVHSACRTTDRSTARSNRVIAAADATVDANPAVPASGATCENTYPFPVEVRIVSPGHVTSWSEQTAGHKWQDFAAGLSAGQSFVLNPGDRVRFQFTQPPTWRWKAIR
ncbi:MAG: hypothetical protein WD845_05745 [Pirellulales bacterium]